MSEVSKESCDCKYSDDKEKGSFQYTWSDDRKQFPDDVTGIVINMPVTWDQVNNSLDPTEYGQYYVPITWTVPRWKLTGTLEKPTLYPSLNWVGVWHGWLRDGKLVSC